MSEKIQPEKTNRAVKGSDSRRRFLKKAAIGAPIVILSANKPAWATSQCTISGMMSGNTSSHSNRVSACQGLGYSPNFWLTANHGINISQDHLNRLGSPDALVRQIAATELNIEHKPGYPFTGNDIAQLMMDYSDTEILTFLESVNSMA